MTGNLPSPPPMHNNINIVIVLVSKYAPHLYIDLHAQKMTPMDSGQTLPLQTD